MSEAAYFVHPSSFIDQPCEIGVGTHIWHFCHVMSGACIGRHCSLGQNVMVASGVKVGDNVKVQNNVSLYSGVTIDDDVFLGPSCVFTNVINPRSEINRKSEYLPTVVRRGATIGANATIVCGVIIGRYAFVGAGAVVRRDVPDYGLMVGVPAIQIGWMSRHGFRLPPQDSNGIMLCSQSGWRYRIDNGILHCLDWPEEKPIT
jgi:UDP-2-acetamido-3-amino-2,3-dideoxy-glucuronate N-acetyltransferase